MQLTEIILTLPVLYVVLQWAALRRMERRWRTAAMLPGVCMAAALMLFVIGMVTNAGFAPIALVLGLPAATLYLLLLVPIHWIAARRT